MIASDLVVAVTAENRIRATKAKNPFIPRGALDEIVAIRADDLLRHKSLFPVNRAAEAATIVGKP